MAYVVQLAKKLAKELAKRYDMIMDNIKDVTPRKKKRVIFILRLRVSAPVWAAGSRATRPVGLL
jgi:ABC-type hemin transport system substrate-binding protein